MASNGLFLAAERGKLTPEHLATYVSGLLFLLKKTPALFLRAERAAVAAGDAALAAHYRRRRGEEAGHDRWAERDLSSLPPPSGRYMGDPAETALGRLIAYLEAVIDRDPRLFLAYVLLAEYLTVLVGPRWLEAVELRCGVPASKLSVLALHVEADVHHADEGSRELDVLVPSPLHAAAMLDVIRTSVSFYEAFWDEILTARVAAA